MPLKINSSTALLTVHYIFTLSKALNERGWEEFAILDNKLLYLNKGER